MATIVYEDRVLIPDGVNGFPSFRRWTHASGFPERGRIDYIAGRIEIDMSLEQLFSHGRLKTELIATLSKCMARSEWLICTDSTRVADAATGLSAEPDLVLVSRESLRSGSVGLAPKADRPDDFVEIAGRVDLVVEIVSDASVTKDTHRLPKAYFEAGVREYWVADARGEALSFLIHVRGRDGFQPVAIEDDGWQSSPALGRAFRLTRPVVEPGWVEFELQVR